ncbi:MAG: hypothetical protein JWN43_2169, partial [Gammaproteobacteria bacterium]|nr:hypothetical protein [Gammaproteobacteria bacterium]
MTSARRALHAQTRRGGWSRLLILAVLLASNLAYAGFDHEWALYQNGIWGRNYQTGLETGVIAVELAGSM